jgi:hypothetical protein
MDMRITRFSGSIPRVVARIVLFGMAMACAGAVVAAQEAKITVLNPTGNPPPIQLRAMTERPASLDGRTIYLVSNTFDNADKFLHSVQTWFAANMPSVKTVYREKKGDYVLDDPDLWKEIKANNGLMVMAIGH